MKKKGDIIHELNSNIGKTGHVIATANSLAEAELSVQNAMQHFKIEVDDSYGLDWKEVEKKARHKFDSDICTVCKVCDGVKCASGMPGMGGPGQMNSFKDNLVALSEYKILPSYIHNHTTSSITFRFLEQTLRSPIMIAPMTGTGTNMHNAIGEYEMARDFLIAAKESNTIAWLGDGASPDKYKIILQAVYDTGGPAILICKPRSDTKAIIQRFREAQDAGVIAVGMDIDAISLRTMELHKLGSIARNIGDLEALRKKTDLPFILKGIMNTKDAQDAVKIGADAIVVSNHGGRILDEMPGTARVLAEIRQAVKSKIVVLADGGIRSGNDVYKMLCLGAQGVLIGRMAAIAAVGSGKRAVKYLLRNYSEELQKTMMLNGIADPTMLHPQLLKKTNT